MRPIEIDKLIKKLNLKASSELDARVHANISNLPAEPDKTKTALTEPNIWRIIMKSPITKLAAAAMVVIAMSYELVGAFARDMDNYNQTTQENNHLTAQYEQVIGQHTETEKGYEQISAKYDLLEKEYTKINEQYKELYKVYEQATDQYKQSQKTYMEMIKEYEQTQKKYEQIQKQYKIGQISRLVLLVTVIILFVYYRSRSKGKERQAMIDAIRSEFDKRTKQNA